MHHAIEDVRCVWDLHATLGEGPVWCAAKHAVWFVDIKQQRIHCFDTQTLQGRSWSAPAQPGFIASIDGDSFVVGLETGLHRFDSKSGQFGLLRAVEPMQASNRLNDSYVDTHGRLWFGSMDDAERKPTGALYRLETNGDLVCLDRGTCITNGPCMSPNGRTFYHTDTVNRVIHAFNSNEDGSLSAKRVFASFAADEGHPDGSIVDAEGCLWVGMWGGWRLQRLSPLGERIGTVALPCAHVTKAVFGGDDLKTLYITTARKGLTEMELANQPLAGGLFTVDVDVPGLPSNRICLRDDATA